MEEIGHRIHDAVKKGNIEDVAKLLKEYPQLVNDRGEDGWTPIFRACYNNRLDLAKFLAENGANLGRDADDFQNSALHACCINGHRQVAEYLIGKGVDVNEYENVGGWTPVYAASFFGWPDLVRLLMKHGANPSIACKEGKKPLDVVCEAGYRGEHRLTIEALLQDKPEPVLPARTAHGHRSAGRTQGAGAVGGSGLSGAACTRLSHAAGGGGGGRPGGSGTGGVVGSFSSTLPTGLGLGAGSPNSPSGGVGGPPPYTEDRAGNRIYFPWELSSADYIKRALGTTEEMLTKLFCKAVEAGKISDMPTAGPGKHRFNFKPFLDAFDYLTLALEHEKALSAYIEAAAAEAKKKKEKEKEKEKEEETDNGKKAADGCETHHHHQGTCSSTTLKKRLEAVGNLVAQLAAPTHTPSREEVDSLLTELHSLAEFLHLEEMAEDVHSLLEQFDAHMASKSLRLRLLRVSQIRGTLEGHERVSARGTLGDSPTSASSSRVGGVSGKVYSPVLGVGGERGGAGGGEEGGRRERKKSDFLEQFKFVQDHATDLVLTDDA